MSILPLSCTRIRNILAPFERTCWVYNMYWSQKRHFTSEVKLFLSQRVKYRFEIFGKVNISCFGYDFRTKWVTWEKPTIFVYLNEMPTYTKSHADQRLLKMTKKRCFPHFEFVALIKISFLENQYFSWAGWYEIWHTYRTEASLSNDIKIVLTEHWFQGLTKILYSSSFDLEFDLEKDVQNENALCHTKRLIKGLKNCHQM